MDEAEDIAAAAKERSRNVVLPKCGGLSKPSFDAWIWL